MARPSRLAEQRLELLPVLARAFSELGFRRATTAELARRCGVRENILYRHWPDKTGMFLSALDHVHDLAVATWQKVLDEGDDPREAATRLIAHEARHLGEFGNHRILFSALGETDVPEIREALRRIYRSFFRFLRDAMRAARDDAAREPDVDHAAWAVIGLGTIATVLGEIEVLGPRQRARLLEDVGALLTRGQSAARPRRGKS